MRMIAIIIKLAPLAVFGAIGFTVAKFHLGSLLPLAKLMACLYLTCISFVILSLGTLLWFNGISIWKLVRYVGDELFIVFGTASSESVLPRLMVKLEQLGCSRPVVAIVLPAGYTFNLDGTSISLTMAALFIAQALNLHLTFGQELAVLLVCLLTSKRRGGGCRQRVHHPDRHPRFHAYDTRRGHAAHSGSGLVHGPGALDDQHGWQQRRHYHRRTVGG